MLSGQFNVTDINHNYHCVLFVLSVAVPPRFIFSYFIFHISYFKHIFTGYKFNKYIVLQFGPVKIEVPSKLLQVS